MHPSRPPLSRLRGGLLALALCSALPVGAQSPETASPLQLPAGSLEQALNTLARQTGIQVLFASAVVSGRQSPAVTGHYLPAQAMALLTRGQGLVVRQRSPGIYVVTTAATAASTAAAAQTEHPGTTDLARLTVSASTARMPLGENAMPNTITVISRHDLEQQLALGSDISSLISSQVAAFAPAREKLSNYGESMRGRGILYMIDGVPQSTPLRDGSRDSHTIDASMIERIEIIHGSNALQGIGGTGGVVNIITKRAPVEPDSVVFESEISGSAAAPHRTDSDSDSQRMSALVGARAHEIDLLAGLAYEKQGLFYDGHGNAIGVNSQGELMDSESISVFAKLGWDVAPGQRLQLSTKRYQLRGLDHYIALNGDYLTGKPTSSIRGDTPLDPPMNLSRSVSLDYTAADLWGGQLAAQAFSVDFQGRYGATQWDPYGNTGANAAWDQTQNESEKRGFKLTQNWNRIAGTTLDLTLGLDGLQDKTRQVLLASKLDWVPDTTYRSLSPLLQAHWWPSDHVMLSGGIRYERGQLDVSDYVTLPRYGARSVMGGKPRMSETLPNVGAVWYVNDVLNLYASYSEGYTVADVGRVLRAINTDGQRVDKLIDLSPVVSDNREIGLEYDDGRFSGDIAYYDSKSDLGSVLVYDAGIDAYNVQRQATRIQGIEANAALRVGEGRLGLGYAHANGRYDYDEDGHLDSDLAGVNIAPDRLTAFWEQAWTSAFSTRLQASRAFDRDFSRLGTRVASFDGYSTIDLIARYALRENTFTLGIQNLADAHYISYYSQTTPSNTTYYAGRGRVVRLTWSYRF